MPNIKSKINGLKKKILKPKLTETQRLCNCLVKEDCSMNGLSLMSSVLYQATIKCSDSKYKQKRYKEICETTFLKRYANDKNLSIEYWTLKQNSKPRDLHGKSKDNIMLITPL